MKHLKITTHWTPQEAYCIYQLLDDLKSAVWASYGTDILAMFSDIQQDQENEDKTRGFDFDDDIEF